MKLRLGPDAADVDLDAAAEPVDLRLVPAAAASWAGVLAGLHAPVAAVLVVAAAAVALVLAVVVTARTAPARLAAGVALAALLAGLTVGAVRAGALHSGPVAALSEVGAAVEVHGVVTTEPGVHGTDGEPYVVGRLRVERVTGRGETAQVRTPVLLVAGGADWAAWANLLPGTPVAARGRLGAADGDIAAVFRPAGPPTATGPPWPVSRLTEPFREGLREAVEPLPAAAQGLVPGLAIGDDGRLPERTRDDMRATGLTHLTAVSGLHVSIVLLAALGLARRAGVRGYGLPAAAVVTIVGFAVLVGPQPSVLRASTMGLIGVLGLTAAGRKRALPALAAAVLVLLAVDPWLAMSVGFALSVLSTAGILVFVPVWRDALPWLPRPLAESVAVPLAAQVASMPVLVGFVSAVSLASVPANLLVAPAVAPATLLGVLAAICSPLLPPVATALSWLAAWPARWIALVAEQGAALPGAVLRWPDGPGSVAASVVLVLALVVGLPRLLRRPVVAAAGAAAAATVLVAAPSPGWPPDGWLLVGCRVGQGDAFVLDAGRGAAVVVDAGPDPEAVDRCLDDLGVERVPLLVLTHYHEDHVGGVPGVLDGRRVAQVVASPLEEPRDQAAAVAGWLDDAGVPLATAAAGERRAAGSLEMTVLWPSAIIGEGEPAANDASVVLDVVSDGVRMLLAGDVEPPAQAALRRARPRLRADVLKVPHHGSRSQDDALLTGLGARVALIGVGEDNRHGHPAPATIELLEDAGMSVWRTDTDGAVAVVRTAEGGLGVAARGVGVYGR